MNLEHAKNLLESVKNTSEKYAEIFKDTKIEYRDFFGYNMGENTIYIRRYESEDMVSEHRDEFVIDYVNEHYGAELSYEVDHDDFAFLHECGHALQWLTTNNKEKYVQESRVQREKMEIIEEELSPILEKHSEIINKTCKKIKKICNKKLYRLFAKHYDKKLNQLDVKVNKHFCIYLKVFDILDEYYRKFPQESFADEWACEQFWDVTERAYEPWRN
jgi:hypothetical protein